MRFSRFLVAVAVAWFSFLVGAPAHACINDSRAPAREFQFKSQYKLDQPDTYVPPGTENPNVALMSAGGYGLSCLGLGLVSSAFWVGMRRTRVEQPK